MTMNDQAILDFRFLIFDVVAMVAVVAIVAVVAMVKVDYQ